MITDADMKKSLGLYIHIPFCKRKCLYCDFCSVAGGNEELVERYAASLKTCLTQYAKMAEGYAVDTVYFGGGTPTLLPIGLMGEILDACFSNFDITRDAEITCETNPATASAEYLSTIRKFGINRLSIGLQSMMENELRALGRIHGREDFLRTFSDARKAGFDNISVDLMYGIPEQTMESFKDTIEKTVKLSPEHISAYCLKVEENTPFGRMGDKLILPDDDEASDMYEECVKSLARAGYSRYEISNFAREGRESKHNLRYWLGREYLGIGAAAHSYFGGERFAFSPNITAFANGEFSACEREKIDTEERMREQVMLRMRLQIGVNADEFESEFGIPFETRFSEIKRFIDSGHVAFDGKNYRFTDEGFFVSSYILSEILDFS